MFMGLAPTGHLLFPSLSLALASPAGQGCWLLSSTLQFLPGTPESAWHLCVLLVTSDSPWACCDPPLFLSLPWTVRSLLWTHLCSPQTHMEKGPLKRQ